jgi:tetratricopeptide (TPR) repeat protein
MLEDILARLKEKQAQGETGITAAFELNWESLDLSTQKLACLLSLFALAPIPWYLVELAANDCNLESDLEVNRDILVTKYLLQKLDDDTYQLHEKIREFLQVKLEELTDIDELKRSLCQAVVTVGKKISQTLTQEQIIKLSPIVPHLAEVANIYQNWLNDEDLIWPFIAVSRFYENQASYDKALPWMEKCLFIARQSFGESHLLVATSLNNLAELYRSQGRYTEAEPLYVQALEMTKQLLGESHPDVANSLNNLAALYNSQGRYTEAEPLYVQALEMTKQLLGESHPDVASSLNNLAALYCSQGRYTEAELLYIQALEMTKQLLGESHPDVASSLNNLAFLYNSQGRYTEAEPLYVQALEIAENRLGENHPNTITIRGNLQILREN